MSAYLANQAVVISDIDTPPGQNITVIMQVDKGLIVLNEQTDIGLNSPASYNVLLAEDSIVDRVNIMNALITMGYSVQSVSSGMEAFQAGD